MYVCVLHKLKQHFNSSAICVVSSIISLGNISTISIHNKTLVVDQYKQSLCLVLAGIYITTTSAESKRL